MYTPAPGSALIGEVWKGAGIVGSQVEGTGRLRLDYEGATEIYPSYADRVERAAERHQASRPGGGQGYPSRASAYRASAYVDPDQVIEVGRWYAVSGEPTITAPDTGGRTSVAWYRSKGLQNTDREPCKTRTVYVAVHRLYVLQNTDRRRSLRVVGPPAACDRVAAASETPSPTRQVRYVG